MKKKTLKVKNKEINKTANVLNKFLNQLFLFSKKCIAILRYGFMAWNKLFVLCNVKLYFYYAIANSSFIAKLESKEAPVNVDQFVNLSYITLILYIRNSKPKSWEESIPPTLPLLPIIA